LCPSKALVGEEVRVEKYVFLKWRQSARVRGWKGILGAPYWVASGP